MKIQPLISFIMITMLSSGGVFAEEKSVTAVSDSTITPVIELFTSEGCSSCPPADEWLSKLGDALDADLRAVPLAFHVDYWNYLGWNDPYSTKQYTSWQKTVAQNNRQRSMYTPEFTVAGRESRGAKQIINNIKKANQQPAEVEISLRLTPSGPETISVEVVIDNMRSEDGAQLHIALFENDIVREIGGGENHGRTLVHDFVVRHWSRPVWLQAESHSQRFDIEIPKDAKKNNLGVAAVVLDSKDGMTLQSISVNAAELYASM